MTHRRPPLAHACVLAAAFTLAASLAGCGGAAAPGSRTGTLSAATQATTSGRAGPRAHSASVRFASVPLRGTNHRLTLPRGWHAELWAQIGGARFEAFTPGGRLLVSSPGAGTITELIPRHHGRPVPRTIASGLTNPQGMAIDTLSGHTYLYVADSDALLRYRLGSGGAITDRRTLVPNLPDTDPTGDDVHRYKNVVVASDHTIFVDIGSSSNATIPAPTPRGSLPRASVVAFHPDGRLDRIWATGVRNGDGLAFAPDGSLWTAVNERDQISYPFHHAYAGVSDAYGQVIQAYVNNHPPDEIARLTPGRNLGWPYCDPDPDVDPGASNSPLHYGNLGFTADQQTNPGGTRLDCSRLAPLQRGLPAHSAPLGFSFLTNSSLPRPWREGAIVAAHGSWDRQPPRPPVVYWMPWEPRTHTLGPAIALVSGFQYPNGSRWGRTVDAIPGPDGSLYVTDDQADAVYRITP